MKLATVSAAALLAYASTALAAPAPGFVGNLVSGLGLGAGFSAASAAVNGLFGSEKEKAEKTATAPTPTAAPVATATQPTATTPTPTCPAPVGNSIYYEQGSIVHYPLNPWEVPTVLSTLTHASKATTGCGVPLTLGKPYRIQSNKWFLVQEATGEEEEEGDQEYVVHTASTRKEVLRAAAGRQVPVASSAA